MKSLLSENDIERFARQIVVPDLGASGQEHVCASTLRILGDPIGVRHAETFARAVGFRADANSRDVASCVLVAGIRGFWPDAAVASTSAIFWYEIAHAGLRFGGATTGASLPRRPRRPTGACDPLLHSLGAAELVATAVGFVLGWADTETHYLLDCI